MSTNYQPRQKDHISIKLHLKRPSGTGSWLIVLVLALVQTVLLFLTTTAIATTGSLYGCSPSCGTPAQPATPAMAIFFGVLILVLPIVIGALSPSWQAAVALAMIPVVLAMILDAGALLTPTMSFVAGSTSTGSSSHKSTGASTPVSHFSVPFWLDSAHLLPLLFALGLFALLAWVGYLARQATEQA
jgi:hypothetical protein